MHCRESEADGKRDAKRGKLHFLERGGRQLIRRNMWNWRNVALQTERGSKRDREAQRAPESN